MQPKFALTFNGQAVQSSDLAQLGSVAATADDAAHLGLTRLPLGARGVMPIDGNSLLARGAAGCVYIASFRAMVGVTGGLLSAISAENNNLALPANSSGNPLWCLIYATLTPNVPTAAVFRKVKDVSTAVVTSQSVSTFTAPQVSLHVLAGTAAASPTWPALPADPPGSFNIALGYVRIPNGFTSASALARTDIAVTATVLHPDGGTDIANAPPTAAQQGSWASSATPLSTYLPSTSSRGAESLIVALDLRTGLESHASGAVVDLRDWRNRICRYSSVHSGSQSFAWETSAGVLPDPNTERSSYSASTSAVATGFGQTLTSAQAKDAVYIDGATVGDMADGAWIKLTADDTTGALVVTYGGSPNVKIIIWCEFSGVLR